MWKGTCGPRDVYEMSEWISAGHFRATDPNVKYCTQNDAFVLMEKMKMTLFAKDLAQLFSTLLLYDTTYKVLVKERKGMAVLRRRLIDGCDYCLC